MPNITLFRNLIQNVRGATAIEYGLIVALIVIAMIAGLSGLGSANSGGWGAFSNAATNAMSAA